MDDAKQYISTAEALSLAKAAGITMSLPTLTKICREQNMGKQMGGHGTRWLVYARKFRGFLEQGVG